MPGRRPALGEGSGWEEANRHGKVRAVLAQPVGQSAVHEDEFSTNPESDEFQ